MICKNRWIGLKKAIKDKERIIIYGDYDVDGVTGTAILVLILQELGAEISYRLPNRQGEGYGLNINTINELKLVDTKIINYCGLRNFVLKRWLCEYG